MTSKIGNERERNKTKWNGTSFKGEKYVRDRWKYPRFHHSRNEDSKIVILFLLFFFFFPLLDTACKPRRNQFNRQIIGIHELGFSRTDSTRLVDRSKLEASPFLPCETRTATGFYPARGRRGESTVEARISTWVNRIELSDRKSEFQLYVSRIIVRAFFHSNIPMRAYHRTNT